MTGYSMVGVENGQHLFTHNHHTDSHHFNSHYNHSLDDLEVSPGGNGGKCLNLTQSPRNGTDHCGGSSTDRANCSSCSTKARLYLKGEKTELTMTEKEKLLECIKQHEVIFNPEHPSRSVRDLVTSAWEDVAEKAGFPVELCKEAWRKIKLAYQNSQRHARSKVNADGSIRKPYYLHKQMTFYEPHLRARDVMNQLVKVDQQAAQERNQQIHSSSTDRSTTSSPNQVLSNPLSSPDIPVCLSPRSPPADCKSPLALDSPGGLSAIPSYSVEPQTWKLSPPTSQTLILNPAPTPLNGFYHSMKNQQKAVEQNQILKRKHEIDFFIPNQIPGPKYPCFSDTSKVEEISNRDEQNNTEVEQVLPPSPAKPTNDSAPPLEVDADLQFLLSLHADMKNLSFVQKFEFKKKVYALMEDIVNRK